MLVFHAEAEVLGDGTTLRQMLNIYTHHQRNARTYIYFPIASGANICKVAIRKQPRRGRHTYCKWMCTVLHGYGYFEVLLIFGFSKFFCRLRRVFVAFCFVLLLPCVRSPWFFHLTGFTSLLFCFLRRRPPSNKLVGGLGAWTAVDSPAVCFFSYFVFNFTGSCEISAALAKITITNKTRTTKVSFRWCNNRFSSFIVFRNCANSWCCFSFGIFYRFVTHIIINLLIVMTVKSGDNLQLRSTC